MQEATQNDPLPFVPRAARAMKRTVTSFRQSPWSKGITFLAACVAGWMITRYFHQASRHLLTGADFSFAPLAEILQRIIDFGSALFR
jgi:hypothetical protein